MPSSSSCSSASSALCSSSAAVTTAFSSRARSTSAGRSSALAPLTAGPPACLRAGLVAALDRRVAPGEQLLQRGGVQGVAPAGQLADGVGGGIEQDAGVVHHTRVSARVERVFRPRPSGGGGRGRMIVAGCGRHHIDEKVPPCDRCSPRRPVLRLRHLRRPAARRHHRRQPRPHGRRAARPRGAGRRADRAALDLRPAARRTSTTVALGLLAAGLGKGDRVGIWAPNCAEWTLVQYATAKIGVILVNINPAYRTHELEYVLQPGRDRAAGRRAELQDLRLRGDGRRGAAELPRAARGGAASARRTGTRSSRRAAAATARELAARCRPSCRPTTRSTSSTRRARRASPRAPRCSHHNILNNGYFVGGCAATPPTTGCASRCPSTTASAW